ncbi:hypothetical protein BKA67DRAFT_664317 [Truncatella angustata]|uniref:RRM domain-containing protein n=1 Tax=Truncatella angustata TaxID=152316 RepID=A0A9P8RNM1_9PEZI|nr:uncharacterized protein BKA67DRAFT_664317 [Truncatella angustata]KAH6646481.1 hypothetical protein BKA67DRAFT_664317 [Truncatella angustata]KAH8194933.1 hypothetical protein TruAng_010898 [Truncatella angustata]
MATRQPPAKPSQGKQPPTPPNQTLYITGLPSSKIQKADLKTALYMLFSTYGPVFDVVVLKTLKMRGQAHVVFRDIQAATQAMRSLEGFVFLGQPMRIQYAKGKSDIIAKLDGTYKMPETAGAVAAQMTETQQSIFNAPAPGTAVPATAAATAAAPTSTPAAASGLPAKPPTAARGQKRTRDEEEEGEEDEEEKEEEKDEEEESDSDVAMEEDSDDE